MELFRITKAAYQDDLSGIGAYHYGGRWNSPGSAMLYTSTRRSLAMLEILVHWQKPSPPPDFVVVVLYVPDHVGITESVNLISAWEQDQQWSREKGDTFLEEKKTLLLRVPSAVVPNENNMLINPLHPDAELVKIIDVAPFSFDGRLFNINK
ncbi:hypothetical protein DYBT9275_01896 [Dyadobacter sp. CECT 9275]|uniref:RES domain-containing protein n=1 Tax=Dyadobacter helix TaxID=2822344 RepID=A0A916JC26_9BACT|nr:RES family NAD+ phosphorylase [Dyadobacter sp. CECT 9275]CAG4997978.1 hypothetical protein DYBT9275_01896 [Dyadobacter sp. CECT 9275]